MLQWVETGKELVSMKLCRCIYLRTWPQASCWHCLLYLISTWSGIAAAQGVSSSESTSSMQCSSKEDFWKILLGQLLIIPYSWQRGVFKLVSLHMNLDAGLVSISNSKLNSVARNQFAGRCTVKSQTMISTPVILECFCGRRAETEEGWSMGQAMSWLNAQGRQCTRCSH